MYIKFTKDHVAGFGEGCIIQTTDEHGERLIEEKKAEKVNEKDFTEFRTKAGLHRINHNKKVKAQAEKEEAEAIKKATGKDK